MKMKIFARLKIISDEKDNRRKYNEDYWALRKRFGIKDGKTLEPQTDPEQKKKFREEVKKLKVKYNIKDKKSGN